VIVTKHHLYTIPGFSVRRGFCRDGARRWFAAHGLDWRAFVTNGIDSEALSATGDGLALALVAWARECTSRGPRDG